MPMTMLDILEPVMLTEFTKEERDTIIFNHLEWFDRNVLLDDRFNKFKLFYHGGGGGDAKGQSWVDYLLERYIRYIKDQYDIEIKFEATKEVFVREVVPIKLTNEQLLLLKLST